MKYPLLFATAAVLSLSACKQNATENPAPVVATPATTAPPDPATTTTPTPAPVPPPPQADPATKNTDPATPPANPASAPSESK